MSRGLAAEALDFAPDLLAIQERPPARLPRAILITTAALLVLLLVWASFAQLDIVASAEGRLVPLGYTKVVQPVEAGVVTEILVKDGDRVHAGQLLLKLDARASEADSSALGRDVALKLVSLKRIDAELTDQRQLTLDDPAAAPGLIAQVLSQFRARRQSYLDAIGQETEAGNRAKAELASAEQVAAKLEQTLPWYRQTAQAHQKLLKEGFIGEIAANEKMREAVEKEQDLKAQRATVESLKANILQSQQRLAGIRSNYRSQLENERIDTLAQLNRSSQDHDKSVIRQSQLEIKAPTDGIVKDLATINTGQVVAAGALLMNLVPQGEPLQAEVLLRNEDAGFVVAGQAAALKIAAFPFQKYGLLDAEVALVSADAQDPKQVPSGQANTLTYKALMRLKQLSGVTSSGHQVSLQPGMLVSAEIHQGRRTVMEYLLSPIHQIAQEAARER